MPTIKSIKAMAKGLGMTGYSRLSKEELIRELQKFEGNSPCFGRIPDCGIMVCLWREDCLPEEEQRKTC